MVLVSFRRDLAPIISISSGKACYCEFKVSLCIYNVEVLCFLLSSSLNLLCIFYFFAQSLSFHVLSPLHFLYFPVLKKFLICFVHLRCLSLSSLFEG